MEVYQGNLTQLKQILELRSERQKLFKPNFHDKFIINKTVGQKWKGRKRIYKY